jgi:periplasmic protein TonB
MALLGVCLINFSFAPLTSAAALVKLREASLRKRATRVETPRFPRESRRRGSTGVAVVSIETNESGDVVAARVLQAPDATISEAVTEAVYKWKFEPTSHNGQPVRLTGKLTFYFLLSGGKPRVESPKFSG